MLPIVRRFLARDLPGRHACTGGVKRRGRLRGVLPRLAALLMAAGLAVWPAQVTVAAELGCVEVSNVTVLSGSCAQTVDGNTSTYIDLTTKSYSPAVMYIRYAVSPSGVDLTKVEIYNATPESRRYSVWIYQDPSTYTDYTVTIGARSWGVVQLPATKPAWTVYLKFPEQNTNYRVGEVRIIEADTIPPGSPVGLTVSPDGAFAANLTWMPGNDSDLSEYQIYRDGVPVTRVDGRVTAYHNTGLLPEQTYAYRLAAVDSSGNESEPSDPVGVRLANNTVSVATRNGAPALQYARALRIGSITASGTALNFKVGTQGFPVMAASSEQLLGSNGSVPGGYYVEILDGGGNIIGSTRADPDGAWSVTATRGLVEGEVLTFRYRPLP